MRRRTEVGEGALAASDGVSCPTLALLGDEQSVIPWPACASAPRSQPWLLARRPKAAGHDGTDDDLHIRCNLDRSSYFQVTVGSDCRRPEQRDYGILRGTARRYRAVFRNKEV
jgi:hypothetical protein